MSSGGSSNGGVHWVWGRDDASGSPVGTLSATVVADGGSHFLWAPGFFAGRGCGILSPMNKAFVKDTAGDDDDDAPEAHLPAGGKYYITRRGFFGLKAELDRLVREERPEVVSVVAWAASNGDRSENGDYIYGKRRLREIDRRIRFLIKRLESATVVDPAEQTNRDQVFFGATVMVADADGVEFTYQIVGVDEANPSEGRISWISPLSRALLKSRVGDTVRVASPAGTREIDVLEIRYE